MDVETSARFWKMFSLHTETDCLCVGVCVCVCV